VSSAVFGTYFGDTDWIDYDRDGDLDLFAVGVTTPFSGPRTQILINDGGIFTAQLIPTAGLGASPIIGLRYAASAWGDFDEDNDLDLLLSGETVDDSLFFALFGNLAGPNFKPNAPLNLTSQVSGSDVALAWDAPSDFETASAGLSYNVRVGTSPGGADVVAPSSLDNGKRQVIRRGNVGSNTGWSIRNLPPGTYYWTTQAIDTDLAGSSFSPEQSFDIN
jgi:hypothetical protein